MDDIFMDALAAARIGQTHNQYARSELRRGRLARYLTSRAEARIVLVGEAAGYRGARVSGIPFTSERQLTGAGPAEATATIVQRVLRELGIEADVLLWNLVPTHPHRPGEHASNRRPTRAEIAAARPFRDALVGDRHVLAVGRFAQRELGGPYVRHPSHGGATAFRETLRSCVATS
jgi:uracil-DNA glycosylase